MNRSAPNNWPAGWDLAVANTWVAGGRTEAIGALVAHINEYPDPKPRPLADQLAYYLFLLGDFVSATRVMEQMRLTYPDDAELQLNYAVCLNRSGQYARAAEALEGLASVIPQNPAVFDGLANAYHQMGAFDLATGAGTQALTLKNGLHPRSPKGWRLPAGTPAQMVRGKKRVVSFSLWGAHARYLRGAVDNALAIPQVYPGWVARFYVDDSVPAALLSALEQLGAEIVPQPGGQGDFQRLAWRFLVANDLAVGYFLVRDVDSVVNAREAVAVSEWLASGAWFHVMRDWWTHTDLILAGMWGGVAGVLPGLAGLVAAYRPGLVATPNIDQWFLRDRVWPYVRSSCVVHDRCFSMAGCRPWPLPAPKGASHVGQNVFAADRAGQALRLSEWIARLDCLRLPEPVA